MPIRDIIYNYTITAAGGTVSLSVDAPYTRYVIGPAAPLTIVADMEFVHTGTPLQGTTFIIEYLGGVTQNYSGGTTVSFFGIDLRDGQALGRCNVKAYYTGSAWNVTVETDLSEQQVNPVLWGYLLEDNTIDTAKIANNKITLAKIDDFTARGYMMRGGAAGDVEEFDAVTSGNIVMGDGTDVVSQAMSGDITINGSGVTAIGSSKVLTTMIADDNVTVAKVENTLTYETLPLLVSFETNEITTYKLEMAYPGTVNQIYAECVKAIAGFDDGTITPKNNAGTTMTSGVITFTASDPLTTAYTVTPSANNTFIAGDILQFTTAKATAGGKVQLSIKVTRS